MKLELLERVKASKEVPWDYDIYNMVVNENEVGRIVFRHGTLDQLKYCGHIGYTVEKEYRGHGYAYQALKLLFQMISLDKMMITCDKENIASKKTIEKCHILSKRLETNILDEEFQTENGLYIYEVEVRR